MLVAWARWRRCLRGHWGRSERVLRLRLRLLLLLLVVAVVVVVVQLRSGEWSEKKG